MITVASEIMAILCLANNINDLKERLGNIIVAYKYTGEPVYARDLKAHGAMAALLKDAIKPNIVQTLEHTPCFVHGGGDACVLLHLKSPQHPKPCYKHRFRHDQLFGGVADDAALIVLCPRLCGKRPRAHLDVGTGLHAGHGIHPRCRQLRYLLPERHVRLCLLETA